LGTSPDDGLTQIDTAAVYKNEAGCGAAINAAVNSGLFKREDVFLTTKVASPLPGYEGTKKSVNSLERLGLDYIDLVLLHSPYGGSELRKGSWKALVEAVDEGKVRSIGVSNYGLHHLEQLDKTLKAVANRCGKTPAQVLIRWSLQTGLVPLPKSNKKPRIKANVDVFDFELSEEDLRELETKEYETTYWDPTISGLEETL
jgi:diketogulonate reductase-like aldo/keto reductase